MRQGHQNHKETESSVTKIDCKDVFFIKFQIDLQFYASNSKIKINLTGLKNALFPHNRLNINFGDDKT